MKILAILPLIPWPLDRGDRMRAWDLLADLSRRGDLTIALATREPVDGDARRALGELSDSIHSYAIGSMMWNALRGVLQGLPAAVGAYWNPGICPALQRLGHTGWDVVVAFQLRAAGYALAVDGTLRAIDFTDSLSMFRSRLPRTGRAAVQRVLLTGIHHLEADMPHRFDLSWVSAPDDALAIARLSGCSPRIVPNGCTAADVIEPYNSDGPLLFMGDMRYPANEDGIAHFIAHLWPAIRSNDRSARLRVIGRPTRRMLKLALRAGIELAGPLRDVRDEVIGAAAVINPVRFGSGSSRKVLTGWSVGRPVISTRPGARGLEFEDKHDILIADTPDEWTDAVAWLRAHPTAAVGMGRAGWMRLQLSYDPQRAWGSAWTTPFPPNRRAPGRQVANLEGVGATASAFPQRHSNSRGTGN